MNMIPPTRLRKTINVLVFPGGTEIGLEIQKALCRCKNVRLYSANLNVSNHAPYIFARHLILPSVHDLAFVDALNKVILEHRIDYIFPAHDDVILALAKNADRIRAQVVSSPLETCLITRSKSETYRFLAGTIPVPDLYDNLEMIEQYPVFVKPDRGQGAQGARVVYDKDHLSQLLKEDNGHFIVTEYLPGEEYTVDCFSDREAGLLFCGGRQRIRIRSGISMSSKPVEDNLFTEYAQRISRKLAFHGAWFFQVKRDRYGILKLLEIAPRIAGTMAVHRVLGVNFPLLSLYEQMRIPIEIMVNSMDLQLDRALVNRYSHRLSYRTVYIDLDDTLVVNGKVNIEVIRFLYQCVNAKKRIVLLTKHAGDLDKTLREHRLIGIFDEVVHMEESASKADYIREMDAILIDDSFSERKQVADRLGLLTFDCSMVEVLLDERV